MRGNSKKDLLSGNYFVPNIYNGFQNLNSSRKHETKP